MGEGPSAERRDVAVVRSDVSVPFGAKVGCMPGFTASFVTTFPVIRQMTAKVPMDIVLDVPEIRKKKRVRIGLAKKN